MASDRIKDAFRSPTTIEAVDCDYEDRPAHRGHTVSIHGWNSEFVSLLIKADDREVEAVVSPAQLRELADRAEAEAHKW